MTTVFCTRELGVKPVPSLAARHKHKHSHTHNNPKLSRGSVRRSSCSRWRDQVLDKTSSARQRRRLVAQERTRHYASASPSDFEAATASTTDKGSAGVASTQEKEKIADVVRKMFISPLAFGVACIPLIVSTSASASASASVRVRVRVRASSYQSINQYEYVCGLPRVVCSLQTFFLRLA